MPSTPRSVHWKPQLWTFVLSTVAAFVVTLATLTYGSPVYAVDGVFGELRSSSGLRNVTGSRCDMKPRTMRSHPDGDQVDVGPWFTIGDREQGFALYSQCGLYTTYPLSGCAQAMGFVWAVGAQTPGQGTTIDYFDANCGASQAVYDTLVEMVSLGNNSYYVSGTIEEKSAGLLSFSVTTPWDGHAGVVGRIHANAEGAFWSEFTNRKWINVVGQKQSYSTIQIESADTVQVFGSSICAKALSSSNCPSP